MMRCAVFIDGNNVFHSSRMLGLEVDYAKLLEVLIDKDDMLIRAFFHTGVNEALEKQKGFLRWMKRNGFMVVERKVEIDRDGKKRANLDVEITTDMLALADRLDMVILVSHDGDFVYPLKALAQRGVRIVVAGFRSIMNGELMDAADRCIDLTEQMDKIRKVGSPNEEHHDFHERA